MMFSRRYYNGYNCFSNFGNPWVMGITLIIILLAIYLIYKLFRTNHKKSNQSLERLNMKYVSGEISQEEYNERRRVLEK
ncbi:SHOCT domain-containing protein [Vallitalea maricola]|uniref:Uncharacterized protein n=1 Tax=Vallitalea maricola TaxID=3074433 RepID=A0ACB5UPD8_9FIRM|nr:hypothetical protein AN2V17_40970 [Vallitalea sp. AN17-2]